MPYEVLEKKLKSLPQIALEEVSSYVDYVFYKFSKAEEPNLKISKKKGFGCLKDIPCKMSPNFDDPLDDFLEYM